METRQATKNQKVVIKDPKKFITFLGICVVIIIIIIVVIVMNQKIKITEGTHISELNTSKYSKEIKTEYDKEEMKDKFVEEYYMVKNAVGMYIMNHSTLETDSFSKLQTTLNGVLAKNDWSLIEIEKPTLWNGTWTVNESGNVIFQFASKDIEPSWIHDTQVVGTITMNP